MGKAECQNIIIMTQDEALAVLKTGANVFLTGEPGSGKTYTVNRYIDYLRRHNIRTAVTASTGIAATHIGGMTVHSWSGIGIKTFLSSADLSDINRNKRVVGHVLSADVLIIDEISMLSSNTLAMVEVVCRKIREPSLPFGGLQVILVGDFFQLPPVTVREEMERDFQDALAFSYSNKAEFAFASSVWKTLNPSVCYLSEQYRQEDGNFFKILSAIRRGTIAPPHLAFLKTRDLPAEKDGITKMFPHNIDVDNINNLELDKLPGELKTFEMVSRGKKPLVVQLKKGCLSPEILGLKENARVIFTKNDSEHRFVNGTLGVVEKFQKESDLPIVKTNSGDTITAKPVEWRIEDGGRALASISQIPLRLAWAITVHKSQGMSLDAAQMDLSNSFEYGQGYVALSRVRSSAGLFLNGFNSRALEIHPDIKTKDEEFRKQSLATREKFLKINNSELAKAHADFIKKCARKTTGSPIEVINW